MFSLFIRRPLFSAVLLLGLSLGTTAPANASARPANALQVSPASAQTAPDRVLTAALSTWIGNRTRMIQVALVCVGLGVLILHGKNHR
jgi:hypothetical protein